MALGNTSLNRIVGSFAPSMRAASMMEKGIVSMNCFIRNRPIDEPSDGRMIAQMVLSTPKFAMTIYCGTAVAVAGKSSEVTMSAKYAFLPGKSCLRSGTPRARR